MASSLEEMRARRAKLNSEKVGEASASPTSSTTATSSVVDAALEAEELRKIEEAEEEAKEGEKPDVITGNIQKGNLDNVVDKAYFTDKKRATYGKFVNYSISVDGKLVVVGFLSKYAPSNGFYSITPLKDKYNNVELRSVT